MPPFRFAKKKRGTVYSSLLHDEDVTKKMVYINITVLDASDAVYQAVHDKVQETHKNWLGPKAFKNMVAHKVAKTAANAVPKKEIARKLSDKVPKMLMYKLHQKMGMRVAAKVVFREDAYAVIQIQIQHVDSKRLLAHAKEQVGPLGAKFKAKSKAEQLQIQAMEEIEHDHKINDTSDDENDDTDGDNDDESDNSSAASLDLDEWIQEQKKLLEEEQQSAHVAHAQNQSNEDDTNETSWHWTNWRLVLVSILAWILHKLVPVTITRDVWESETLPAMIQSQISSKVKHMLDKKLAKKNMKAETAVLREAEQARYFFTQLQKIRSKDDDKDKTEDVNT